MTFEWFDYINTQMNDFDDQIKNMISSLPVGSYGRFLSSKSNKDLLNWLKSQVNYETNSISELVFLYQNPTFNPFCDFGKKRKFHKGKYLTGCGKHCDCVKRKISDAVKKSYLKIETKQNGINKSKQTFLKKYGVDNPLKSKTIQEKIKNTNIEKYGFDNARKNPEIGKKIIETNLNRYGHAHYSQTESFKQSIKNTSLEKFGVDHYLKSDVTKRKIKQTLLQRYGVDNPMKNMVINKKAKETNCKKYGVHHVLQSKCFQEKNVKQI